MKQLTNNLKQVRSFSARIGAAVGLLLALGLLLAASASATYEQVATFADKGQNTQLVQTAGMAVNVTGVGGVPAGTVYAIRENGSGEGGITSYNSKGEFREVLSSALGRGIAVDQATGNIYFLSSSAATGESYVAVYSPNGVLISTFGVKAAFGTTIDESPEKLHAPPSGIAVDDSGVVYVSELESRVMVFEPQSPDDYEHYVYAGRSHDIATDEGSVKYFPERLALDFAGNLYTVSRENAIYEFAPGDGTAPSCEFKLPAGGIQGITVNPESGEVFYFSYKNKKIHQLAPCNAEGKLVETTAFAPAPATSDIYGLAFNPAIAYEASRPAGVLYAACQCEEYKIGPFGSPEEVHGRGFIFAPPVALQPPSVESESVSLVTASTATLGAQIDPKGSPTRYLFQYITDAEYQANEPSERFAGASEAPLGGAPLGSGTKVLSAAISLAGLAPDTEYHYRVIATSHCNPEDEEELCEGTGPAQAFRTFPAEAPGLPDNRAWELVSPVQKYGGEVFPVNSGIASCGRECKPSANGLPVQSAPDGEAVAYSGNPFSFTQGAVGRNEYVARRTAAGWQTTILSPILGGSSVAFNAELTQGLLAHGGPPLTPAAPSEYENLYAQSIADPSSLSALIAVKPSNRPPGTSFRAIYAGASADFSQLFFEANDALSEETPFAPKAVDGGESNNNLYEWANGQLRLVNVLPGNAEALPGAEFGSGKQLKSGNPNGGLSADYSHAISADGSRVFWSDESGQVYLRENGETTKQIPDPGRFLSAAEDGSKVLLNDGQLYDLQAEETTDLSDGKGGFQGIAGQSNDLASIYFVDTAVLSGEEENSFGKKAQAAQNNLYSWHEGAVTFIATLDAADNNPIGGVWQASPAARTAEASPDGRWVAFLSRARLTDYDNTGSCNPGHIGTAPCAEVFLYDSASGRLSCPSCNPSGVRPLGPSTLAVIAEAEGSVPQPRYLTNQGRLYFDTQDSLTPFDTNDGVEDVYQYEPEGIGSCKREGGCLSLISAGHEPIDSNFLAADEAGKNVFFTSRDQLVLKDRDDLIDLYVAREDGGIAAETEAVKPPCQGEACVPAIAPPNDPTPGSSTFEGAGNVDEKKAAKKKKHKKKRKHAKKHSHKRSHGRAANNNRGGAK